MAHLVEEDAEFDYDHSLALLNEEWKDSIEEKSSSILAVSVVPCFHLPPECGGIRLLEPFTGSEKNERHIMEQLQQSYGFEEPPSEAAGQYVLWSSILPHENFALKEFPAKFRVNGKPGFRFRKHSWGTGILFDLVFNIRKIWGPCQHDQRSGCYFRGTVSFQEVDDGLSKFVSNRAHCFFDNMIAVVGTYFYQDFSSVENVHESDQGPGYFPAVFKEISALRTLGCHRNIVHLLDIFAVGEEPRDRAVVLVFAEWGYTLREVIQTVEAKERFLSSKGILGLVIKQLLAGVMHIHSKRIIHRNITTSSVKVGGDGTVRVGSFSYAIPEGVGLKAAPFPEEDMPIAPSDTFDHLAPEIILGSKTYDTSSDMWSVGLMIVELHRQSSLYEDTTDTKLLPHLSNCAMPVLLNIFRIFGTPNEENFPGVWELPYFHHSFPRWPGTFLSEVIPSLSVETAEVVSHLLTYRSASRPTANGILSSRQFFAQHAVTADK